MMKMKFTCLLAAIGLVTACDYVRVGEPVRYGEISVAIAGDPEMEVVTKAGTVVDPSSDEAANYIVRVYNQAGEQQGEETGYKDFGTRQFELGTYYLTAEDCTEAQAEEGNGRMRLSGRSDDIALSYQNLSQTVEISCTVANAKVSVQFDESVQGRFSDLKAVLTGGTTSGRTLTVNQTDADVITETWFNPSTVNYTISGTFNSGGINAPVTLSGSRAVGARDNVLIQVKVDSQNGQLEPTVIFNTDITESDHTSGFNPYKRKINN